MSVTQEIKNRLDIVDVVSDYGVQLRKSGRSYAGFCPFHPNTKTPAFYVFPESQTWRCFGACAEGGDVFTFVMKKNGWDFKEALADLARKAGVELEERRPQDPSKQAADERLFALLTAAADYYHQLLLHAPQAEAARRYVGGRGLTEETLAAFKLGFSLDSWDAARNHFTGQGYREDELVQAGLLSEHEERKTHYDRFRGRLMFPIRDVDGRVVGFGARTLDPDGVPKYLNSPQTPLFDKGHLIYGLDMAKRHIREARKVVIVEGYMDAIQAWQAGFRNVVAQMGTALTEPQLRLLQRFTKQFVVALDADAAGEKATRRGLDIARLTLDREFDVEFDAKALQRQSSRLNADLWVVELPSGNDPDKIIRADPAAWPKLLAAAKPITRYIIELMMKGLDRSDPKAKVAIAEQVLPIISDIRDPIERDDYRQLLGQRLGIDEKALRQKERELRDGAKRKAASQPPRQKSAKPLTPAPAAPPTLASPPDDFDLPPMPEFGPPDEEMGFAPLRGAPRKSRAASLEEHFLRQVLEYPGALTRVNAYLMKGHQREVTAADFTRAEDKALFPVLQARAATPTVAAVEEMCDSLDAVLAERVRALLALPPTPDTKLDRLPETLTLSVLDWRLEKLKEGNDLLQGLLQSGVQSEPDSGLIQLYREQVDASRPVKRSIDLAKNSLSAIGLRRAEEAARKSR